MKMLTMIRQVWAAVAAFLAAPVTDVADVWASCAAPRLLSDELWADHEPISGRPTEQAVLTVIRDLNYTARNRALRIAEKCARCGHKGLAYSWLKAASQHAPVTEEMAQRIGQIYRAWFYARKVGLCLITCTL